MRATAGLTAGFQKTCLARESTGNSPTLEGSSLTSFESCVYVFRLAACSWMPLGSGVPSQYLGDSILTAQHQRQGQWRLRAWSPTVDQGPCDGCVRAKVACRGVVQMTVLAYILTPGFALNRWWLTLVYSIVLLLVASAEAVSDISKPYWPSSRLRTCRSSSSSSTSRHLVMSIIPSKRIR